MACKPDSVRSCERGDHSSQAHVAMNPLAANPNLKTEAAHARLLFGIAPGGACLAGPVASPAVGSYPTVSPLPASAGGLFSVALSVGLLRPGVTRHRCFVESGLSSKVALRGHPAIRAIARIGKKALPVKRRPRHLTSPPHISGFTPSHPSRPGSAPPDRPCGHNPWHRIRPWPRA